MHNNIEKQLYRVTALSCLLLPNPSSISPGFRFVSTLGWLSDLTGQIPDEANEAKWSFIWQHPWKVGSIWILVSKVFAPKLRSQNNCGYGDTDGQTEWCLLLSGDG